MQLDGSYFRGWIDHNGVAFSLDLLEWDRFLSGFEGSENSGREGFEGSPFYGWIDYNRVAFSLELLQWNRTSVGIWGIRKVT